MEEPKIWPRPFTSALTRREAILVFLYLPIHLIVLQLVLGALVVRGDLTEPQGDLIYYAAGFGYMVCAAFGFLRRDFDALLDAPFLCVREVLRGYLLMYCCNMVVSALFLLLPEAENPNDAAVLSVAAQDVRTVKAVIIYLAPVVEELLFRAGAFGVLRRKNRAAAYAVSALCFSLYHVAPYALTRPLNWLFLLEYLPVSLLLARCYERTNSIWCSIFFHMLVNGVSFAVLGALPSA